MRLTAVEHGIAVRPDNGASLQLLGRSSERHIGFRNNGGRYETDAEVAKPATNGAPHRGKPRIPTCCKRDLLRPDESKLLVTAKCRLIVPGEFKCGSKRYRVFQCLSRALPRVRQHGMCGVSEQSDASFSPNSHGIAIKQFVESDVLGPSGSNDRLKSLLETGADTMRDFQRLQRAPSNVVGRHG